ncbi:Protein MAINTENANCE OF MERISTEMS [Linum grandiflorum]
MDDDSSKGLTYGIAKMRAGKGKGLVMSTRLDNRVNITTSARRVVPENEPRKKRKKQPINVYSEPEIHLDITILMPSNVMHDRVVSDDDETDMGYEEPLQGDPHQVGTGSSHASASVGPTRGVTSFVQASGLYHLGTCMTAPLDTPLLQAFIERSKPDTNTFHMSFGEMNVTLHDVWYILRVPIGGTALLPNPNVSPHDAVTEYLGYKTGDDLRLPIGLKEGSRVPWMKSGAVHVRGLIARAASMGDVSATKMFLYSLRGSSLFVDKTSDRARVQLFEFVRVADEITKYAWGTATLAWLYMQLGNATRADIVGRARCMHLLQSWIHEYFPHTRK